MLRGGSCSGKMMVIGHRGSPREAPENTLPSFLMAMDGGADGIELDVSLSRDGALIVFHNYTLPKTTDGRGMVARQTLARLKSLDAGSFFSEKYAGTRIPTLREVVEVLGEGAFIMIEIKTSLTGANRETADAVSGVVARYNLYKRVVVLSLIHIYGYKRCGSTLPMPIGHRGMNRLSRSQSVLRRYG